ncbi:hypothetical protein WOLCODRAFT_139847 [Wolfiporia cocos MD-104 SS10]|uniref:RRM domain-containing protein n=1 Tax=Wolfiporia cocos (strain MD-104) TaxID=742152 RepID=A0A2H3JCB2_WOLCO|nr:hypothetical protein WOLCODRAFT_139847 [Wolfiporia cocos MD-104 SS10]
MVRAGKPYTRPMPRSRASDGQWLHDKAPGASTAVQSGGSTSSSQTAKIIVSNLHYELTTKDLTQIFGAMGTLVREPLIRYDRSGRSSGVAIITYEIPAEAEAAKDAFNGKLLKGQPMTIAFYTPPQQQLRGNRRNSAPTSLLHRIQKPPLLDRLSTDESKRPTIPTAPKKNGLGPVRTKARAPRVPKKPKTAEELDMELDAFMKDDVPAGAPAAAQADKDVEMA